MINVWVFTPDLLMPDIGLNTFLPCHKRIFAPLVLRLAECGYHGDTQWNLLFPCRLTGVGHSLPLMLIHTMTHLWNGISLLWSKEGKLSLVKGECPTILLISWSVYQSMFSFNDLYSVFVCLSMFLDIPYILLWIISLAWIMIGLLVKGLVLRNIH